MTVRTFYWNLDFPNWNLKPCYCNSDSSIFAASNQLMKNINRLCTAAIWLASVATAQAQEGEIALDPITVTSSLSPMTASKTGRNLIVIKGEELSKLPVHSVDELLRYVPGIEVQARGPMGSQSDIVMRGGTFQQVLVIVDGLRVNDPVTGHFNSYIPVTPAEIDRIEILKGAASAIYGTEAVGGVIHVITKTFAAKQHQSRQQLSAQVGIGEYGLWTLQAGGVYQHDQTAVSAGVVSNNSNGQPQRGTRGFFNNTTASASVNQYINSHWQLSYRTSYDTRRFAAQNFYTTFLSDTAEEKVNSFWNQLRVGYQKGAQRITFDAGYKTGEDHYTFSHSTAPNINNSKLWQALLVQEWKLSEQVTLLNGAQWINKKITSNDRGNHMVNQTAVFTVLNSKLGEHLLVSPALRLEWNERYGWELVPQVNASYRTTHWQFRGSAGKTTRDADFTERYNNYNKAMVRSGSIGNPDLDAEHSFSYEAGADYFAGQSLKIAATFFERFHDNLIDWVNTPYADMPRKVNLSPGGSYALAKNIATVTTTGAEADVQYNQRLNTKDQLWATVGVVWLHSTSSEATPSFYISSHAKWLTNFNLQYIAPKWTVSVNGLYKNRSSQAAPGINAKVSPEYTVVNAKAEAFVYQNKISVYAEADNVFNTKYSDLLGAVMPGRWWMGGIKISLSK